MIGPAVTEGSAPGAWQPFAGRKPGWVDLGLASTLAAAYLAFLMATTSMGITRDESFYVHYGKVYLNWFVALWDAPDSEARARLLSEEEVKKVWKNNSEHPPLAKVLFGASWKLFGKKMRDVQVDPQGRVKVNGLGPAHGFQEGDVALLLAPSLVGEDPSGAERRIGYVQVRERSRYGAKAAVLESRVEEARLAALCSEAQDNSEGRYQTPCQVQSDGPLQLFSESQAFRFPGAFFGAMLVFFLYLLAAEWFGRLAALVSVLLLAFMPHVFFHAHLNCFDVPIAALSLAVLFAFYRSLRSAWWAVATGFLWGLALLTKLNAFFIPVTLGLWWIVANRREFKLGGRLGLSLPKFPLAFLFMPLIGLPMLYLLWPWLWHDTVTAFWKYASFHLKHEHYFQYYFGRAYQSPPFPIDYPFVFTLVTTPVVTLLLALVGGAALLGRAVAGKVDGKGAELWYLAIHGAFPICLIALPSVPIFGGMKHWLLSYPFLCMLGGVGFGLVMRWAGMGLAGLLPRLRRAAAPVLAAALLLLLMAPAVRDTLSYGTYGTSYFNELIGGVRGAASARMQRQFWSYASRGALDYVNRVAPPDCAIDFQDATGGTCEMCKLEGWMRHDLRCVTRTPSPEILLFDVEERFTEEEMRYWKSMDTVGPEHEVHVDGIPVLRVYRKHAGLQSMENHIGTGYEAEVDRGL